MIKGKTLNNQQSMFNDEPELATGNSQLLTRFSLFLKRKFVAPNTYKNFSDFPFLSARFGRVIKNLVPSEITLSTDMLPPSFSTAWFTM
jgi:hypothetical protein